MTKRGEHDGVQCRTHGNKHHPQDCTGTGKIKCDLCGKKLSGHRINQHAARLKEMGRWLER